MQEELVLLFKIILVQWEVDFYIQVINKYPVGVTLLKYAEKQNNYVMFWNKAIWYKWKNNYIRLLNGWGKLD